jgi:hypothetical protein
VNTTANASANELISLKTTYAALNTPQAFTWRDGSNITAQIDTRYNGSTVDMVFGSLFESGYNNIPRMIIRGNGNVGIGTSSPSQRLTVS